MYRKQINFDKEYRIGLSEKQEVRIKINSSYFNEFEIETGEIHKVFKW